MSVLDSVVPNIHSDALSIFQVNGDTKVEIPNEDLDRRYVEKYILTNTDRFLEDTVSGNLRTWHVILMISGAVTMLSNKHFSNVLYHKFIAAN